MIVDRRATYAIVDRTLFYQHWACTTNRRQNVSSHQHPNPKVYPSSTPTVSAVSGAEALSAGASLSVRRDPVWLVGAVVPRTLLVLAMLRAAAGGALR